VRIGLRHVADLGTDVADVHQAKSARRSFSPLLISSLHDFEGYGRRDLIHSALNALAPTELLSDDEARRVAVGINCRELLPEA
jgi:hypothetical protein